MADIESLKADITLATTRLNELRQQNTEAAAIEHAKKTLGDLKKSLAALSGGNSSKDSSKKKERLLLKTAKVCALSTIVVHSSIYIYTLGHTRLWPSRNVLPFTY
jgi:hypothetical protein